MQMGDPMIRGRLGGKTEEGNSKKRPQPNHSIQDETTSDSRPNYSCIYQQAGKLGRCDSYLQSETINDSLTHSLAG